MERHSKRDYYAHRKYQTIIAFALVIALLFIHSDSRVLADDQEVSPCASNVVAARLRLPRDLICHGVKAHDAGEISRESLKSSEGGEKILGLESQGTRGPPH